MNLQWKIMEVFLLLLFCHFESLLVYRNMYFKLLHSSPPILLLRNSIFLLFFTLYLLLMFSLFLSDTAYLADTSCGEKSLFVWQRIVETAFRDWYLFLEQFIRKFHIAFHCKLWTIMFLLFDFRTGKSCRISTRKRGFQELNYHLKYFQK